MEYSLAVVFRIMSFRESNRVPFSCVFRWGNSQKSEGPMSGEYGGCRTTSSASSWTVTRRSCMTTVRTWSVNSSFRLVDGLLERVSLSTDVRRSLNRFYHSLICVMPIPSSPKTHYIFRMVSIWLSPRLWQNLMQYRCPSRSVIFAENNKCNARCVYTLTHTQAARDWRCLLAEKIHVSALRSPPPSYHSTPPVLH
jgi:hypothetical protein